MALRAWAEYGAIILSAWMTKERRQALLRAIPVLAVTLFALWTILAFFPLAAGAQQAPAAPTPAPTPCNSQQCVTAAVNNAIGVSPGAGHGVSALGWWDPTSQIAQIATGWLPQAQSMAQNLYSSLFVIELFMVGLQTILFRDNLGEFLSSFTFKIFTAGFFFWLISDAGTLLPMIIGSFRQAGNTVSGADTNTLSAFYGEVVGVVLLFITAAGAALAGSAAAEDLCFVSSGCAAAVQTASMPVATICAAMAILMFASLMVVSFTYIMITIEAFIVMCGGVLLLGLAGTRFTSPMSQGYLRYAFNVGVKLFAFWLIISIEEPLMKGVLANAGLTAGTALLTAIAAAIAGAPFAVGAIAIIGAILTVMFAAMGALQVIVLNGLATAAPSLASSMLSGSSLFNAQSMLKGVAATFVEAGVAAGTLSGKFNQAAQAIRPSLSQTLIEADRAKAQHPPVRETNQPVIAPAAPSMGLNNSALPVSSIAPGHSEEAYGSVPSVSGGAVPVRRPAASVGGSSAQAPVGGRPVQAPVGGRPVQAPAGGRPVQAPAGGRPVQVAGPAAPLSGNEQLIAAQLEDMEKQAVKKREERYGFADGDYWTRDRLNHLYANSSASRVAELLAKTDRVDPRVQAWFAEDTFRGRIWAAVKTKESLEKQSKQQGYGRGFIALEALTAGVHSGEGGGSASLGGSGFPL